MNKRIEEIAIQAKAWFPIGCPSAEGGDDAWTNLVIFEKEDLEKFTELIIQENAAELRRLYAVNQELLEELELAKQFISSTITKATGETE